jgi:hypothetical protein
MRKSFDVADKGAGCGSRELSYHRDDFCASLCDLPALIEYSQVIFHRRLR